MRPTFGPVRIGLAFSIAAILLAVTPGPGIAYVVARTVAGGRSEGLASCLGTGIGGGLIVDGELYPGSGRTAVRVPAFEAGTVLPPLALDDSTDWITVLSRDRGGEAADLLPGGEVGDQHLHLGNGRRGFRPGAGRGSRRMGRADRQAAIRHPPVNSRYFVP